MWHDKQAAHLFLLKAIVKTSVEETFSALWIQKLTSLYNLSATHVTKVEKRCALSY